MKNKSFTLIELLVVIAIIGLLASIIIVNLAGTRSKANIARGLQFSQSIYHALGAYAVGVWSFDEGSGTIANDASGYGNNGTLVNDPIWRCASADPNYTPSGQGCSLQFDGVNDYVDLGDKEELEIKEDITISAWVKPTKSGQYMIVRSGAGADMVYGFFENKWQNYYDGSQGESLNYSLTLNEWSHVVVIRDLPNAYVYINGKLNQSASNWANVPSLNPVRTVIGGYSTTQPFGGLIDEVRIYKEALTSAQIQKLYAKGVERHRIVFNEK